MRTGQRTMIRYIGVEKGVGSYVFAEEDLTVPVEITGEYEHDYTATVLQHRNPIGWSKPKPYPITLDKWDLEHGVIKEVG